MNELISIITPMYNAEKYIEKTIQSVILQTYENWEMIIINDCSTDDSLQIVEKYVVIDSRIKIISHNCNMGISAARNTGIVNACGRYIAFLDSDDIWKSDKLAKQIAFMQRSSYLFTYTACELINESGESMQKAIIPRSFVDYKSLLKSNCIVCSSVIIDANTINLHVPFVKHEDYATWLDILKNGHTAYAVNDVFVEYRIRKSSVSANKFKSLSWVFNIYRNHLKMSLIEVFYRIIVYFCHSVIKYFDALNVVFKKR